MAGEARNTAFVYLYRDADNYKKWGRVVFGGKWREDYEERLRIACRHRELFVADQVDVPEVFLWAEEGEARTVADHGWHEFWELEATGDEPDDERGRTIEEFVGQLRRQGESGWEVEWPR